jgi:iron complex transport system substrate-binding protein
VKGNGITMTRRHLVLLSLTLVLAACAATPGTPGTDAPTSAPPSSLAASAAPGGAAAFPVTLTDDTGASVTIASEPQRIVSLAPSNTEIVCAVDACDRLVGVTDFDDYPPQIADVPDVVVAAQVDVEAVVAADPDLVLAAGNELTPSSVIAQLGDLGLTVMTLYPETLDEVYADIELIGAALGSDEVAADLVSDMRTRASAVEDAVAGAERPRTFYEVGVFENTIYTAGSGSFLASLIDLAGGEPITGDATGTIALESLVAADPELILLGDATYDQTITPESVVARPGWGELTAVREDRVIVFTDDLVVTRPGPRVVDGLEALAHTIHPEAFD